jgi:hypothetical protein
VPLSSTQPLPTPPKDKPKSSTPLSSTQPLPPVKPTKTNNNVSTKISNANNNNNTDNNDSNNTPSSIGANQSAKSLAAKFEKQSIYRFNKTITNSFLQDALQFACEFTNFVLEFMHKKE